MAKKREEKDLPGAKDPRSEGDPREGGGSREAGGVRQGLGSPRKLGALSRAEGRWRGSEQLFLSKSLRPDVENMGRFKERMRNSQRPSWLRDLAGPRPRVRVRGLARRTLCPECPHLPALPTAHTQLKSQRAQGRKFDVFMTAQNGKN